VTPYYTLPDSSSPTVTNVVGFTQFGGAQTATPTKGSSGGTAVWIDSGSSVKYTSPIAGGSGERWQVSSSDSGTYAAISSVSSPGTATVEYYHQFSDTLSYSVSGGGSGYSAPSFSANKFGSSTPQTLPTAPTGYWYDSAASWSVSPNPLTGSSGSERWDTNQATSGTLSSTATTTVAVTYYNQYSFGLDYAVSGGGSGYSAPTLTATQFSASYTPALGTSSNTYWLDTGLSWGVTNPLAGSGSTEQWISGQTISGSVTGSSPTTAGSGTLTFTYQNQYSISIASSGISSDSSGMVATLQGTSEPQSSLPHSVWVNSGASCTYSFTSPVTSTGTGKEYVWSSTSGLSQTGQSNSGGFTVSTFGTIAGAYGIDYQLTVTSAYGSPTGAGWYNAGGSATFGVTSPASGGTGTQYLLTSWSGSGSGAYSGPSSSTSVTMNNPITETAIWQTQYYLTVTSSYGSPSGQSWYNAGSPATFGVTSPSAGGPGTQYLLTSWSGSGSGAYSGSLASSSVTMSNPITETASWQTQYYLTLATNFGSTSPTVGDNWENAGAQVTISATAPTATSGEQYLWNGWTGSGTGQYSGSTAGPTVTVNNPIAETASWTLEYQIAVAQSDGGTISPGTTYVAQGGSQTFTITPNTGYHMDTLTVDGVLVSTESPVTFSDVVDNTHSISATFAIDTFTIVVSQTGLGTISGPTTVNWGDSPTFTATPADGYHLVSVTIDGNPASAPYTISDVTDNSHTINADFAINAVTATTLKVQCNPEAVQTCGGPVYFTGKLTDADGNGVGGMTITVCVNTGNGYVLAGSATTNDDGTYSTQPSPWNVPELDCGFYVVQATFVGNSNYAGITAYTTSGTGNGGLDVMPEYLIGALGALAACFAGCIVFRKRSNLPHFKRQM
jgi:hypothetical protein